MNPAPAWGIGHARKVADTSDVLSWLRSEFPHVGIVADPRAGVWLAVKGNGFFVRATTGVELRERLIAAQPYRRTT